MSRLATPPSAHAAYKLACKNLIHISPPGVIAKIIRARALASRLPEELFERILSWIGPVTLKHSGYSWYSPPKKKALCQCALVSKYWAPRCQASIFRCIKLRNAKDVRGLLTMLNRPGTAITQYIEHLKWASWASDIFDLYAPDETEVPWQAQVSRNKETPWLHLLPLLYSKLPHCSPNRHLQLSGPLPKGMRTIRTVHYSLPRTLPAYSTHINKLSLHDIVFACFSDLVHLLDELRNLRELYCSHVTWVSGVTPLRASRPRCSDLECVELINVRSVEECALWLLFVYRAPQGTQRAPQAIINSLAAGNYPTLIFGASQSVLDPIPCAVRRGYHHSGA